jgi:peptide chain release factor subunit 1
MSISEKQKYEMKKILKELGRHKGRHTELVSVYVPQDYDMTKVINHLQQEQGTATNIKSTSTRKNVIDALEKMIQHLRLFKKTPEHGLAVFSGNVAEREGQSDVKVWSIEPPVPLKTRIYRCDKEFVLNLLEEIIEIKEAYGLVVLDRRDATLALLKGKAIIPLQKTHSEVPGKTRAGGQSALRFARLREGATKEHYKKVAEYMKNQFLGLKELKGILIGGPSTTTNDFMQKDYLTGDIKKKIIGIRDLSYTDEFGLQELLDKSQDILASEDVAAEKKTMHQFFESLARQPNKVSYGERQVMAHIRTGAVDTVLLSEDLSDDKIDEFEREAQKMNSAVKIISTETREGVQLRELGKVAALLRYEVHQE